MKRRRLLIRPLLNLGLLAAGLAITILKHETADAIIAGLLLVLSIVFWAFLIPAIIRRQRRKT